MFTLAELSYTMMFVGEARKDMPEPVKVILDVVDTELRRAYMKRKNESMKELRLKAEKPHDLREDRV